jgi:micrococcal nuclease
MGSCCSANRLPAWKDCKVFVPPVHKGRVIKVYDGDTITVASKLPFRASPMYRFQVRLRGIDAPELKSKNAIERLAAKASQQALEDLLLTKTVKLGNVGTEKYGRILADVYLGSLCANTFMLQNKLAVPYDGGKKVPYADEA